MEDEGEGELVPTALPTAPPISVQSRTIAVVMAMSTCGTAAWDATEEHTAAKPPPIPCRTWVMTTSASEPWTPREWIIRPTPLDASMQVRIEGNTGRVTNAQETDGKTGDENPFVAVEEPHADTSHDTKDSERDGLCLVEVGRVNEGPV